MLQGQTKFSSNEVKITYIDLTQTNQFENNLNSFLKIE